MTKQSPLESVPLQAGETLSYARDNTTFHRSFDYCLAVSDRAVYFYVCRFPHLPRWVRISFEDIKEVEISSYSGGPARVTALFLVFFGIVAGTHVMQSPWWVAVVFGLLITYWGYQSMKGLRDRTQIVIERNTGMFVFRTPVDAYYDEKNYDRNFLLQLGETLQQGGVKVELQCQKLAQQSAPADVPNDGAPLS